MLNLDFYVSEWSKKPLSIPEIVRLSLSDEGSIEFFFGPVVSRLDAKIAALPKTESGLPTAQERLLKRNRYFLESLRYWIVCEQQGLPLPRETMSQEVLDELLKQREARRPRMEAAKAKEDKQKRIAWLEEKIPWLDNQMKPLVDQKNMYVTELSGLKGGKNA